MNNFNGETKRAADTLELDLHEAGVAVTAIHGDRSQAEREEAAVSAAEPGAQQKQRRGILVYSFGRGMTITKRDSLYAVYP